MSVTVTMRVFSTRANPTWQLTPQQEMAFRTWFEKVSAASAHSFDPGGIFRPECPSAGYRGFDVSIDDKPPIRVYPSDALDLFGSPDGQSDQVDQWLRRSDERLLSDEFELDHEIMRLQPQPIQGVLPPWPQHNPRCGTIDYPGPDSDWNDSDADPDHPELGSRFTNLCYNYANNVLSRFTAMPKLDGHTKSSWNADTLELALRQDGLRPRGRALPATCPSGPNPSYIAACVHITHCTDTSGDFHFIRLDSSGGWSHKFDTERITNLDAHREPIRNLSVAQFRVRLLLIGFFETNEHVRQHLRDHGSPLFGRAGINLMKGPFN